MNADEIGFFIIGIAIGVYVLGMIWAFTVPSFSISQETGDDICKQITGNSTTIAESEDKKLICITPSYDSTHNIIVKSNSEEKINE